MGTLESIKIISSRIPLLDLFEDLLDITGRKLISSGGPDHRDFFGRIFDGSIPAGSSKCMSDPFRNRHVFLLSDGLDLLHLTIVENHL